MILTPDSIVIGKYQNVDACIFTYLHLLYIIMRGRLLSSKGD